MKNNLILVELKGGVLKMEKSQIKDDKPDFRGKLDVSAWINTDKNGKKYLSIVIENRVNLFRHDFQANEIEECELEDIFE